MYGCGGGVQLSRSLLEDENFALHLLIAKLNCTALVFFAWRTFVLVIETIFFS